MKTTRLSLTTILILAACARLEEPSIKTIFPVDGKAPDAELAHKHGMRYVHDIVEVPHVQ